MPYKYNCSCICIIPPHTHTHARTADILVSISHNKDRVFVSLRIIINVSSETVCSEPNPRYRLRYEAVCESYLNIPSIFEMLRSRESLYLTDFRAKNGPRSCIYTNTISMLYMVYYVVVIDTGVSRIGFS